MVEGGRHKSASVWRALRRSLIFAHVLDRVASLMKR